MINDPELKAMSEVYDALLSLNGPTQKRVVDWVLSKLESPGIKTSAGAKRGPKLKSKKRGPKPGTGGRPKGTGKILRGPGRPPRSKNKNQEGNPT